MRTRPKSGEGGCATLRAGNRRDAASWRQPKDAARSAAALTQAMTKTTDATALPLLAEGLSAVAVHMEPQEAPALYAHAGGAIIQAMIKATDKAFPNPTELYSLPVLAQSLSPLAARMQPKQAAELYSQAAAILTRAMTKTNDQAMTKTNAQEALRLMALGLSALLTRFDAAESSRRAAAVAAPVPLPGFGSPVAIPAFLGPALEPLPCRFTTPELVELLKQPTCVGPIRRVVLDHLENRYRRKFSDHWDFVHFAQDQHLGLDFTSPPSRTWAPFSTPPMTKALTTVH